MTALAELMRALMPFASDLHQGPMYEARRAARDVLRKHAPCELCLGSGCVVTSQGATACACSGAGWTPASVEAAIDRVTTAATITVERFDDGRYNITVGDTDDWVFLEPQDDEDSARAIAEDTASLLKRLGVQAEIRRLDLPDGSG